MNEWICSLAATHINCPQRPHVADWLLRDCALDLRHLEVRNAIANWPFTPSTRTSTPLGVMHIGVVALLIDICSSLHLSGSTKRRGHVTIKLHVRALDSLPIGRSCILQTSVCHTDDNLAFLSANVVDAADPIKIYFCGNHAKIFRDFPQKLLSSIDDRCLLLSAKGKGLPSAVGLINTRHLCVGTKKIIALVTEMCAKFGHIKGWFDDCGLDVSGIECRDESGCSQVYWPIVVLPRSTNILGTLHGGVTAKVFQTCSMLHVCAHTGSPSSWVPIDTSVTYLRAAPLGARCLVRTSIGKVNESSDVVLTQSELMDRDAQKVFARGFQSHSMKIINRENRQSKL